MKKRVLVNVASREYTLLSEEDESYVYKIAGLVDNEIAQIKGGLALTDAAILACLNMADRLLKTEDNTGHMRDQLKEQLDEIQKLKSELAESRRENTRLKSQLR